MEEVYSKCTHHVYENRKNKKDTTTVPSILLSCDLKNVLEGGNSANILYSLLFHKGFKFEELQ